MKKMIVCTSVAFVCVMSPASAQQGLPGENAPAPEQVGESDSASVGEIIVTAQKRSQSINDVPMSITALSGDALAQAGVTSVADLARIVPGLSFTKTVDAQPVYFIRGIGYFDTSLGASPAVTSYVDEVPLPYPVLTSGATLDLERVEVLKGPQGTLFGQNSTGGALNFIPAKPTEDLSAGGSISFGRFAEFVAEGFVSGPLTDTLRVRVAARHERSDDWQKSYTRDESWGKADRGAARMLVDWTPTDRLEATFNLNGWYDKSELQQGQLAGLVIPIPGTQSPELAVGDGTPGNPLVQTYPSPPRSARAADWTPGIDNSADNKFWQASLRTRYDISDAVSLTAITSYQHLDFFQRPDGDGTRLRIGDFALDGVVEAFSQELRLNGELGRLSWMVGGNYLWDKVVTVDRINSPDQSLPVDGFDALNDQRSKTWAAFGNAEFKLTDQLTLQGGMRYTNFRQKFRGCARDPGDGSAAEVLSFIFEGATFGAGECLTVDTVNGTFQPGLARFSNNADNLSWRAGVNYEPNRDVLFYANISRGYKTSSFPLATFFTSSALLAPRQESVLAYEAGFKLSLADRKVQFNGAAFYYDYSDKQLLFVILDPVFGPAENLQNIPKSRIAGAELDLTIRPVEGLTLSANGTYVNSKVRSSFVGFSSDGTSIVDVRGEAFPFTPKWQLAGNVDYRFPISASANATLGATGTYRGATSTRFGDIADLFQLPEYGLVDLRAGIEAPDRSWYAQLWGRNVTNKNYRTSIGAILDTIVAYAGRPATYGVTVGARF